LLTFSSESSVFSSPVKDVREEHRMRVFENRVLRRTFGPKRDEVMGGWRDMQTRSFVISTLRQV
jgi:hypothetical protein